MTDLKILPPIHPLLMKYKPILIKEQKEQEAVIEDWSGLEDKKFKKKSQTIYFNSWQCFNCFTSQTPMRRCGPDGKNSLCNACGLYWKKHHHFKKESYNFSNDIRP